MKKLLLGFLLTSSVSVIANCKVYIEGNGYNDTLKTVGGFEDSFETLPKKYKFSPKSMLKKELKKNGYIVTEISADARYKVTKFGGRCYNQWIMSECDFAGATISIEDNVDPSNDFNTKTNTDSIFGTLGYIANSPSLIINTSGKSAYQKALNNIPSCK